MKILICQGILIRLQCVHVNNTALRINLQSIKTVRPTGVRSHKVLPNFRDPSVHDEEIVLPNIKDKKFILHKGISHFISLFSRALHMYVLVVVIRIVIYQHL